jgi:Arc/MetJ-type ribon-helix-helix transcriptional regulator
MVRSIISLSEEDKKWLEHYGRKNRLSAAEVIRRALRLYRRELSKGGYERVLHESAGTWKSIKGDSQDYVEAIRAEWEKTS